MLDSSDSGPEVQSTRRWFLLGPGFDGAVELVGEVGERVLTLLLERRRLLLRLHVRVLELAAQLLDLSFERRNTSLTLEHSLLV